VSTKLFPKKVIRNLRFNNNFKSENTEKGMLSVKYNTYLYLIWDDKIYGKIQKKKKFETPRKILSSNNKL